MSSDIESYKARISSYSISQLEEILLSLDRNRFPDKYEVVKKALHRLKSDEESAAEAPSPPSENLEKTIVDESSLKSDKIADSTDDNNSSKEKISPSEELTENETLETEQKEETTSKKISEEFNSDEEEKDQDGPDIFQMLITALAVITSVMALYCILLINYDLPGKSQMEKIAVKLPGSFSEKGTADPDEEKTEEISPEEKAEETP